MFPSNVIFEHRLMKVLDYALSPTPNDVNAIKPLYIKTLFEYDEQKIKDFCFKESIRIKKISYSLYLLDKYKNDQLEKISSFMNFTNAIPRKITETFIDALPWQGIEIQNMESNNVNKSIQQESNSVVMNWRVFSQACENFFEYLNFFDLAKLERVSSHFLQPIDMHLKEKYSRKKLCLFVNFNLEEFLMEIDNGAVDQTREFITVYEFRFIMRYFGHLMENIIVQTDCLKATLNSNVIDPTYLDYENIVDIVGSCLINFIDEPKCKTIIIDYVKIRDSYVTKHKLIRGFVLLKDLNYFKYNKMLHKFEMHRHTDNEWLQMLSQKKYLRELTILTDYPLIERRLFIEFLENGRFEKISISSQNDLSNHNCDDVIAALVRNSSESLLELIVKDCHSEELANVINRFSNLKVLVIENISGRGGYLLYKLFLPNLRKFRISSCDSATDDFCYNFIRKHKNLQHLNISNCECIEGTFLSELNDQLNKNSFEMDDELEINITDTTAGYFVNRGEIQITNKKLKIINENKEKYSDDEITTIIDDRCDLADLSANDCFDLVSNHEIPLSFKRILEEYRHDMHLNLNNYCHLSEKILKFIATIGCIKKLTINTYYPKINCTKINEYLNRFKIPELSIVGYDTTKSYDKIDTNLADSVIICVANNNMNNLASLAFAHCFIGPMMTEELNKFINLNSLMLVNVSGLLQQNFDKLKLPKVEKIELWECSEIDDGICFNLIKCCPNLKQLNISKCNSIEGFFLPEIDKYVLEKQLSLNVTITESPAVINYWRGEFDTKYIKVKCNSASNHCLEDDLEKYKMVLDQKIKSDIKVMLKTKIYSMILIKRSLSNTNLQELLNIYSKLHHLENLILLMMSYFNPSVHKLINFSKLKIKTLEIQNEEFYEKDLTADILEKLANFNPNHLNTIKLVKCKINIRCIVSLNKLQNLKNLTFEKVDGLSNDIAKKISSKSLTTLNIMDNNNVCDKTCMHIIKQSDKITHLSVVNCCNITEGLLEELCILDSKLVQWLIINISGTPAGYHYLHNFKKYSFKYCTIHNNTNETHLKYMKNILLDSKTVKSVPSELISMFQPTDLLDLTESFPDLNDLSFELISQLEKLRRLKMFSNYKNVLNREQMVSNITKLNLERLMIEGNADGYNCEDIIEALANNKPNVLLEISIRNCTITTNIIKSLNKFRNVHEVMISNENTNYLKKIMEEFEFSSSTLFHMYVNDLLIENNTETIERVKKISLEL